MARPRRDVGKRPIDQRLNQLEFGPTYPCIRGWQLNNVNIVTGDGDPLSFDTWENCSPDYFTISPSGGLINDVTAHVSGLYAVHFSLDFDETLDIGVNVSLAVEQATSTYTSPMIVTMPAQPRAGDNSSGRYSMVDLRAYPPIWVHAGETTAALGPSLPTFVFNASQDSGSDKNSDLAMFEIYLLGGIPCDISELG